MTSFTGTICCNNHNFVVRYIPRIGGGYWLHLSMVRPSRSLNLTELKSRYADGAINTTRCSKPLTATPWSRTPAPGSSRSPAIGRRNQAGTGSRPAGQPGWRAGPGTARVADQPRGRSGTGIRGSAANGWPALRSAPRAARERSESGRALGGPLIAPPQRATVGDFVGLCLLIDFSDEPGTISRSEVDNFCNQPGYSGFGNGGSSLTISAIIPSAAAAIQIWLPTTTGPASQVALHRPRYRARGTRPGANCRGSHSSAGQRLRLHAVDRR